MLLERDSLPAFVDFVRLLPRALRWRKIIQARARVDGKAMHRWFGIKPE